MRYTALYSFVFRLIYFAARNVKEMLFGERGEKFVQRDVENFFSSSRLMRKSDLRFSRNGIIISYE